MLGKFLVADAHCDTLLRDLEGFYWNAGVQVNFSKMRQGGVAVQFFAVFVDDPFLPDRAFYRALELITRLRRLEREGKGRLKVATAYDELKKVVKRGKVAAVLALEGGEPIGTSFVRLDFLIACGVRVFGLTWNRANAIAAGAGAGDGGGLTPFGRKLIPYLNRRGVLIDLAHIARKGFWQTLELSAAPVMVSHTCCYRINPHPRNLTDEQLKAVAQAGGLVGLTFVPEFAARDGKVSLETFLDHVVHAATVAGTESLGLGSDFDGMEGFIPGLMDASCFPGLAKALAKRGFSQQEIRGIMGFNLLKLLAKVWPA
ncbi:MAG: rane dipeptidase [Eubacteriales bacterium]|nr:rane dipeptidase [Eubacteriales bacterium]